MGISKWKDDHAIDYASKGNPAKLGFDLSIYEEEYGSGASFAAMCPATSYWQATMSAIVDTLVNTYDVHGVYIDQIGAAAGYRCFDPSHGHDIGDGTQWVAGYQELLYECRTVAPGAALVTESNAEPYMNQLHGLLTLTSFEAPVIGNGSLVPVFSAVYGGYYVGFGAIFTIDQVRIQGQGDSDNGYGYGCRLII